MNEVDRQTQEEIDKAKREGNCIDRVLERGDRFRLRFDSGSYFSQCLASQQKTEGAVTND